MCQSPWMVSALLSMPVETCPVTSSVLGVLWSLCLLAFSSLTHPHMPFELKCGSFLSMGAGGYDKLFICTQNFVFTELCHRLLAVIPTCLKMAGTDFPLFKGARSFFIKHLKSTCTRGIPVSRCAVASGGFTGNHVFPCPLHPSSASITDQPPPRLLLLSVSARPSSYPSTISFNTHSSGSGCILELPESLQLNYSL